MRSSTKTSRKKQRPLAQNLRQNSTDAEMAFWRAVRDRRLLGLKFKRQCPIDGYVVDFICAERGLIVEIDGGQHNENKKDVERDAHFSAKGLKTVRFWNNDVLSNLDGVLTNLTEILGSLTPIREANGGRGRGVRGRVSNTNVGDCCATPSSRPSPATRLRRAGGKEQKGKVAQ